MSYILRRKGYGEGLVDVQLFSKTGLTLETADTQPHDAEYVFRWGCTANTHAKKTLNSAAAIHKVFNKREFRRELNAAGLCPKTWLSSIDWIRSGPALYGDEGNGIDKILIRKNNHSRSED